MLWEAELLGQPRPGRKGGGTPRTMRTERTRFHLDRRVGSDRG